MTLSIISLVVATIALAINLTALVRRPRIVAEWGCVSDGHEHGPPMEGLSIIVTARRRQLQVDEVGIVLLPKRTWRRRLPEWLHEERPFRYKLGLRTDAPVDLTDGQSVRAFTQLDFAIEEFDGRDGVAYSYVQASGVVYLVRDSEYRRWLNARRRVGEVEKPANRRKRSESR